MLLYFILQKREEKSAMSIWLKFFLHGIVLNVLINHTFMTTIMKSPRQNTHERVQCKWFCRYFSFACLCRQLLQYNFLHSLPNCDDQLDEIRKNRSDIKVMICESNRCKVNLVIPVSRTQRNSNQKVHYRVPGR